MRACACACATCVCVCVCVCHTCSLADFNGVISIRNPIANPDRICDDRKAIGLFKSLGWIRNEKLDIEKNARADRIANGYDRIANGYDRISPRVRSDCDRTRAIGLRSAIGNVPYRNPIVSQLTDRKATGFSSNR